MNNLDLWEKSDNPAVLALCSDVKRMYGELQKCVATPDCGCGYASLGEWVTCSDHERVEELLKSLNFVQGV